MSEYSVVVAQLEGVRDSGNREAVVAPNVALRSRLERLLIFAVVAFYVLCAFGACYGVSKIMPNKVVLSWHGKSLFMGDIAERILGGFDQYLFAFSLLVPIFAVEARLVGWKNSSFYDLFVKPTASSKTDLMVFVAGETHVLYFVGRIMVFFASIKLGMVIHDWLAAHTFINMNLGALPLAVQFPVFFLIYTFIDYWRHRLDHTPLFWPLHRYHHAAKEFSVLTSARQHPAEITGILLVNIPLAMLNASPEMMTFLALFMTVLGYMWHSRVNTDLGWFGRWGIVGPVHHRLHHRLISPGDRQVQFGALAIWDRMFGTWEEKPTSAAPIFETVPIGVETEYRHGLWIVPDIFRDYLDFWKGWLALGKSVSHRALCFIKIRTCAVSGRPTDDGGASVS